MTSFLTLDFAALLEVLDPGVVLRADRAAVLAGAAAEVRLADPERLRRLDLAVLDD